MFTVHLIVRFQYKTITTVALCDAMAFVADQQWQHSVRMDNPTRSKGNLISTNDDSNTVVGTYTIV